MISCELSNVIFFSMSMIHIFFVNIKPEKLLNEYYNICGCLKQQGQMVFITEGFLEAAIESRPEWDLNPRPLNSVQTL